MRIEDARRKTYGDLLPGDSFVFEDALYLKLVSKPHCARLGDGVQVSPPYTAVVEQVNKHVVVPRD